MANMTDTGRAATYLNWATAGGSIGSAPTQPFNLRLMTAMGTSPGNVNGENGTEATSSNCPGYSAGGGTLGASAPFGSLSSTTATGSNANQVQWSATGNWTGILGIEIWDSSGTSLRWFQGTLGTEITGVVNGDTVAFAPGSLTLNASQW